MQIDALPDLMAQLGYDLSANKRTIRDANQKDTLHRH
jgi:hypothetical protein